MNLAIFCNSKKNNMLKTIQKIAIFFFLLTVTANTYGQYLKGYNIPDTTYKQTHSAHKATFLSAVLPGLGQVYNEKYWKVPIIYGAFTGLTYYASYNNFVYNKYREGYNIKVKIDLGELSKSEDIFSYTTKENLLRYKDLWRRYRDLCFIGMGLVYVAQIIDANVDAHLFDYDINEDLSIKLQPTVIPLMQPTQKYYSTQVGLSCSISF